MKRLIVLILAAVLLLPATANATVLRRTTHVGNPTCDDLSFQVEVENQLARTVRIQAVLHTKHGPDITTFHVGPGEMVGVRIPVHFGYQRGWSLTVVRSSWANFQRTGWGWLADGYAYLGWSC